MGKFWGDQRWGRENGVNKSGNISETRKNGGKVTTDGLQELTNALLNSTISDPLWPPLPRDWGLQLIPLLLLSQEQVKLRTSNFAETFIGSIGTKAHEKCWEQLAVGVFRQSRKFSWHHVGRIARSRCYSTALIYTLRLHAYLKQWRKKSHCCSTRDANFFKLMQTFSHRVVNIWNSLPSHIAQTPSVATFKGRLGAFDFSRFNCF